MTAPNLEQIQQLSDDELRIKVAELLGWRFQKARGWALRLLDWLHRDRGTVALPPGVSSQWRGISPRGVPDYPNDLNACHEMEMALRQAANSLEEFDSEDAAYYRNLIA